jgi:hypothetical protein
MPKGFIMRRETPMFFRRWNVRKVLLVTLAVGLVVVARPLTAQLIDIKAEKFIEYITVADPYREWQTWPGKHKLYQGKATYGHGALITTYVNRAASRSMEEKSGMADGSIIVVENYDAAKKLQTLTTMYKVKGFNPQGGDWYWVEATPKGEIINSGKVQACIDCHRVQAENDYIRTGEAVKGNRNQTTR